MSSVTPSTSRSLRSAEPLRYWWDYLVYVILWAAAAISVITTLSIVGVLLWEGSHFFREVSFAQFFGDTQWLPGSPDNPRYGIWPLVCGTMLIAVCSALFAVPLGLLGAVYLSEYASPGFRNSVKPALEILAGIPSVVLGYFALILISPALRYVLDLPVLRDIFPQPEIFNALSASIAVAVMIIPTVISLSEDVLRSVPKSLREAAYALGSTKFEVTTRVVVPAALSGIMAAIILAISRAVGETMAVAIAAGQSPNLTINPLNSVETMTAFVANSQSAEHSHDGPLYYSLYGVCGTLFAMTLAMNLCAQFILSRFQERYE